MKKKICGTALQESQKKEDFKSFSKDGLPSQKRKKLRIFLGTVCGCIYLYSLKHQTLISPNDTVLLQDNYCEDDNPLFATVGDKNIYIVKEGMELSTNQEDIWISDLRDKDADIKIFASYRIQDWNLQSKIIDLILEYNEQYPSTTPWTRSKSSLQTEWLVHNIAYQLHYEEKSSRDVDFHNDEEQVYRLIK